MADTGRVLTSRRPSRATRGAPSQRYMAFLSYAHRDEAIADWLHRALEEYRVPPGLVGKLTDLGPVPARLTPVFRDRHELAAADDLGEEIEQAIAGSRFLVVLCSPAAAQSRWTNAEIACFKKLHGEQRVLAAIVDGEPFASDLAGREAEECFPPALREKHDARGRPTGRRAEPLAADLRETGDGREAGLHKIVAGMLGVGLDELVQREARRRQRRTNLIAASSVGGMLIAIALALTAIQARDAARDERRAAEGLVGFMLGDLRQKLEPIGRLDVLDSVGERALAYYASQDRRRLSDDSLAQRAKALTMMGEIAFSRGQLDKALARYDESFASTAELLDRQPDNAERLFNHAQNVFWVGYVHWQRGRRDQAAAMFRDYRRLAERMVKVAPGNPAYELERIYADTNLGTVLLEQRKFAEAGDSYQATLREIEALAAREPGNRQYQDMLLEALAWLADARQAGGRLDESIAHRQRELSLLSRMWAKAADHRLKQQEVAARSSLARLLAMRGDMAGAMAEARRGEEAGKALLARDPSNAAWLRSVTSARLDQAEIALLAGQRDVARGAADEACRQVDQLLARDPQVVDWSRNLRFACQRNQTRLALLDGQRDAALDAARQAVTAARSDTGSRDAAMLIAQAEGLLGEALRASGQADAARGAELRALAGWPPAAEWRPRDMALRAALLRRAGRAAEARPLTERLAAMGYRQPDYVKWLQQGG